MPVEAQISASFTVSLPAKITLTPQELAEDETGNLYGYEADVGVQGDIGADAVVKVRPDHTVTMYDVSYRPEETTTTPTSEAEQSEYVHKAPMDATTEQNTVTWRQEELVKGKDDVTDPYTFDEATGYHNTAFAMSLEDLPSGKWEGTLNFAVSYEDTYVQPGIYNESGELATAWADLVSEGAITVEGTTVISGSAAVLNGSLNIPDGMDEIGDGAFEGCTGLTGVTIPDGVTVIGENAFKNCTALSDVTIAETVDVIGTDAFADTAWFTARKAENPVVVANNIIIDVSGATGNVVVPSGVKEIASDTFTGCTGITSISVPDTVTEIGTDAFKDVPVVYYNGSAAGSTWGATAVRTYEKLTEGSTYSMGGYQWVCAEVNGVQAVMQSAGVTGGSWPGYKMAKFGNGSNYTSNIDGQDISEYDDKTTALYNNIKSAEYTGASYGTGLFLVSNEKAGTTTNNTKGSGNYCTALKTAAANRSSSGASYNYAWLGTVNGSGSAWRVDSGGYVNYSNSQNSSYVLAPAFNLDTSKIALSGTTITVNGGV